jgi:hypothetical protein
VTELTTSRTDPGLSITIFKPVASKNGLFLAFLIVLHYMSLVLSSQLSGSLLSSSSVLVSLSQVKIKGQGHDCLGELVVGMSTSFSKISVSQSSETSQHISPYNSHQILSFITLLCKAMIATEGSCERKYRGYHNLWSVCCSHIILRMWGHDQSVCM